MRSLKVLVVVMMLVGWLATPVLAAKVTIDISGQSTDGDLFIEVDSRDAVKMTLSGKKPIKDVRDDLVYLLNKQREGTAQAIKDNDNQILIVANKTIKVGEAKDKLTSLPFEVGGQSQARGLTFKVVVLRALSEDFDWKDRVRTLKICFDETINGDWVKWLQAAVDNWNSKQKETSWSFTKPEKCPKEAKKAANVLVKLGEPPLPYHTAPGVWSPGEYVDRPSLSIETSTIFVNPNLLKDCAKEGIKDGWGTSPAKDMLDPIHVLTHELGHALRLDHVDWLCHEAGENPDKGIMRVYRKGRHIAYIAPIDIENAKEAAKPLPLDACKPRAQQQGYDLYEPQPPGCVDVGMPTLTEWGLIALGLLLAGSLAWMIRRRFSARPAGA